MSIPKIIHQTFKDKNLPFITRWHIGRFLKRNPEYRYEFYDDERIEHFIAEEYDQETLKLYRRLNIGAAKADFFRYAVLYKKGGIYLDIDSGISGLLRNFINSDDVAIITREGDPNLFAQWALIFAPSHPFLKKTMEIIKDNIVTNKYPNDVHKMTGPSVYTEGINASLSLNPSIPYRLLGTDYNKHFKVKYKLGKFFLYRKGDHWKTKQLSTPVLKPDEL
ncbi:glycosyltransferase family 32 protein [Pedobacter sp. JCM 36344]|uniref:glycosyltransferase family 32 protein n=1 Tax=Pedobacter sp. JCM 36344 TaxID=3374280 RepID=UPI00397B8351